MGALKEQLAAVREELPGCVVWRVPCAEDLSLIGTGTALVAGGTNRVVAFEAGTGRRLWEAPVGGRALSLAAADGVLVVSTDAGVLEAFRTGGAGVAQAAAAVAGVSGGGTLPESDTASRERVDRLLAAGMASRGWVLVAGIGSGRLIGELLRRTELGVVAIDAEAGRVAWCREALLAGGWQGSRASAHRVLPGALPFTDYFANAVVSESGLEGAAEGLPWPAAELDRVVRPWGGVGWTGLRGVRGTPGVGAVADGEADGPRRRGPLEGGGEWTHQFGNPANTANSGDGRVGASLRLQWFGGPGPERMVDRHLRAPAPLSAGGRLFVPSENGMLAVDAYNGTLLWQRDLPGSQRYTMPYDAGYQSVQGDRLAVAVRDECWLLAVEDGVVRARWPVPVPVPAASAGRESGSWHWGYVALSGGGLFGTIQQSTASRTVPGYEQIDADYNNEQPLVTGVSVFRMDPGTGRVAWARGGRGVLLNTTVTLHAGLVLFAEARGRAAGAVAGTGRVRLADWMAADPWLVALDAETGAVRWEQRLDGAIAGSRNVLYLLGAGERLVLMGSGPGPGPGRDTRYWVESRRVSDGTREWEAEHGAGKPGEFTHGEQVHHPVVLGNLLVAEPVTYDLATGRRVPAPEGGEDWRLVRPGHSCGTLSGAGDCVFFRANNPTALDVRASLRSPSETARKLAPSRTGCWINMIPAGGLLLVPEASAGCVCQYSLQTSMGFLPVTGR